MRRYLLYVLSHLTSPLPVHRVCWAPFVGIFLARISRGRTINELFVGSLLLPSLVCMLWISTWGGISLRHTRQALELESLGSKLYNDSAKFLVNGTNNCYHVPQHDLVVDGEVVFHNYLSGITPVCHLDMHKDGWTMFNIFNSIDLEDVLHFRIGHVLSLFAALMMILFSMGMYSMSIITMHYLSSNGTST
jgi:BCCT, betaine/carnitine/choline family transporter